MFLGERNREVSVGAGEIPTLMAVLGSMQRHGPLSGSQSRDPLEVPECHHPFLLLFGKGWAGLGSDPAPLSAHKFQ